MYGCKLTRVPVCVGISAALQCAGEPSMDQSDGNENAAETAAAEFCNSLEGYNAMGKQLGVALAKMYGHQQSPTADNTKSRKRKA